MYRFMSKMENLSVVEEEVFSFLRRSFRLSPRQLRPAFETLLVKLRQVAKNKSEARAFAYLDIISWLESKIENVPVGEVIRARFLSGTMIHRR